MKRYLIRYTPQILRVSNTFPACLFILMAIGVTTPGALSEKPRIDWSQYPITWHVCQDCGMPKTFRTITEALVAARPGDTINIWGEQTFAGLIGVHEYHETLVIDKPITLTCLNPEPSLGFPVIAGSFDDANQRAVITILPDGTGTVISNLRIRGPQTGSITDCASASPFDCMMQKAGIRIEASGCRIENCRVTRCMTGILVTGTGNAVTGCRLGDRWRDSRQGVWAVFEEWSASFQGHPIDHPGNGFGIVVMPTQSVSGNLSVPPGAENTLRDNEFRGNRYTNLVILP